MNCHISSVISNTYLVYNKTNSIINSKLSALERFYDLNFNIIFFVAILTYCYSVVFEIKSDTFPLVQYQTHQKNSTICDGSYGKGYICIFIAPYSPKQIYGIEIIEFQFGMLDAWQHRFVVAIKYCVFQQRVVSDDMCIGFLNRFGRYSKILNAIAFVSRLGYDTDVLWIDYPVSYVICFFLLCSFACPIYYIRHLLILFQHVFLMLHLRLFFYVIHQR